MSKATKIQQSTLLIHSSDLVESHSFYSALGLTTLAGEDNSFSDGNSIIRLSSEFENDLAFELIAENTDEILAYYSGLGIIFSYKSSSEGSVISMMNDPNGLIIYLKESATQALPSCNTSFDEFALSTKLFGDSVNFWGKLGFECIASRSSYPRTLMLNQPMRLGLHDAKSKPKNALYFSIEADQLNALKMAGFPIMKQANQNFLTYSPEGLEVILIPKS